MLEKYIVHACGGIDGISYTNSREALELAYKNGHRFIEFDTNHTSDGTYVLIHDWDKTREKLFGKRGRVSFREFKSDEMIKSYSQMSLDDILEWFVAHPDTFIVTDTKDVEPAEFLEYLQNNYPDLLPRTFVQIYFFSQYAEVHKYSTKAIIFGSYHLKNSDEELLEFLRVNPCHAVSMSAEKAEKGFALKVKKTLELPTIVFPVNSLEDEQKFRNLGIDYFFTDYLYPNQEK